MHSYDLQTVVFASVFSLHFFVLHIRSITSDSQHENDSKLVRFDLGKKTTCFQDQENIVVWHYYKFKYISHTSNF